jgi:uncharacterized OB-fold protein
MADTKDATDQRPAPFPDGESAPYWEAAKAHRFELQHCAACAQWIFPPRALCPSCWTEPVWKQPSGRGTVYTFTIMRDSFMKGFPPPYVVAEIELEEQAGLRLVTNIVGCDADDVRIGMPVEVTFEDRSQAVTVPQFRPRRG